MIKVLFFYFTQAGLTHSNDVNCLQKGVLSLSQLKVIYHHLTDSSMTFMIDLRLKIEI